MYSFQNKERQVSCTCEQWPTVDRTWGNGDAEKREGQNSDILYTLKHIVKLIEEVKSVSGKDVFGNLIELKELESWKISL